MTRPTLSKPMISIPTELVRPVSISCLCLNKLTRALPLPSSKSPLTRTPNMELFPASTLPLSARGCAVRARKFTVSDNRYSGFNHIFHRGGHSPYESLSATRRVFARLGGCACCLDIATHVLGQEELAIGPGSFRGGDQSCVCDVPLVQRELHAVSVVLVPDFEHSLTHALVYPLGYQVLQLLEGAIVGRQQEVLERYPRRGVGEV